MGPSTSTSRRSVRRIVAAFSSAALLLAACGGDDDGGPAASDTTSSTDSSAGAATTETTAAGDGEPVPSAGCGSSAATGAAVREEKRILDVGGVERYFLLTDPEGHDADAPVPLVLDFHGLSEGAEVHTRMSAFSDLAEEEGFVVAFPHGTGTPVQWNTSVDDANPDLAYVTSVLDTLVAERCLDESRVYATGLSMGAMMSSTLACTMADRFAAIAPVAGITRPDGCDPDEPVPVLAYHGTADQILLFNGGVGDALGRILGGDSDGAPTTTTSQPADLDGAGYPATVAEWAEGNDCEPDATDAEESDELIRRTYDCPDGADVEFVIVQGGGHTWPGSELSRSLAAIVGPTTTDIDATEENWRFFQRHQRR